MPQLLYILYSKKSNVRPPDPPGWNITLKSIFLYRIFLIAKTGVILLRYIFIRALNSPEKNILVGLSI